MVVDGRERLPRDIRSVPYNSGTYTWPPVQPSEHPIMQDRAYNGLTAGADTYKASVEYPDFGNHIIDSLGNAAGSNWMMADTHVAWQEIERGVSWRIFGRTNLHTFGFWTPTIDPPAGETIEYLGF